MSTHEELFAENLTLKLDHRMLSAKVAYLRPRSESHLELS